MSPIVSSALWMLFGGAIGAIISFFVTKKMFEKQVRENPPINEKMIRAM
ncbi:MAG TPA: YneF family protein, partial [Erysipelothrix sp.]|nr:YneF family protein [Erysipelothrix sp.]